MGQSETTLPSGIERDHEGDIRDYMQDGGNRTRQDYEGQESNVWDLTEIPRDSQPIDYRIHSRPHRRLGSGSRYSKCRESKGSIHGNELREHRETYSFEEAKFSYWMNSRGHSRV